MTKKLSLVLSAALIIFVLALNETAAQSTGNETVPVNNSTLAAINLPARAQRVKDASVPQEIRDTLAKIVASGGDKIRQGDSEVVLWTGDYTKSNGSQMIKKLESALQNSGWEYEINAQENDFVLFNLFRAAPQRRALVGFFVPSEDAFVFALTEMTAANATAKTENQAKEINANLKNTNQNNANSESLIGKWSRGEGSGFIDYTGKTKYKSGVTYSFEFFADGTVEYVYDSDVLSIVQCRTKETSKARGTYKINSDSLTISLGAMNSIGTSSCDAKNNFNKTLPASTVAKKFKIQKMDSLFRPDNPTMLCFDGQDGDACFERSK